jgi:hypothetical protein
MRDGIYKRKERERERERDLDYENRGTRTHICVK